jgi:hypothetical protein
VEFATTYGNCFNKPYFQPDFPNKTTLVAMIPAKNKPYFVPLVGTYFCIIIWRGEWNKVIRLFVVFFLVATKVVFV